MSRSYKKTPVLKERVPGGKRKANKRVRREGETGAGAHYKKVLSAYDVIGRRSYCTKEELKEMRSDGEDIFDVYYFRK